MSACNVLAAFIAGAWGRCGRRVISSTSSTWALCLPMFLLKNLKWAQLRSARLPETLIWFLVDVQLGLLHYTTLFIYTTDSIDYTCHCLFLVTHSLVIFLNKWFVNWLCCPSLLSCLCRARLATCTHSHWSHLWSFRGAGWGITLNNVVDWLISHEIEPFTPQEEKEIALAYPYCADAHKHTHTHTLTSCRLFKQKQTTAADTWQAC